MRVSFAGLCDGYHGRILDLKSYCIPSGVVEGVRVNRQVVARMGSPEGGVGLFVQTSNQR